MALVVSFNHGSPLLYPSEIFVFFLGGGGHMHPFLASAQYIKWKINFWLTFALNF